MGGIVKKTEDESFLGNNEETLSIEVTTHCNSNCLHCFARTGNSELSSLPISIVKEIINEGYYNAYRQLHITGGEPLLWEELFNTLDYAFGRGYNRVYLNTNGRLLTEDVNSRLAGYDGLSISVSLEGPESLHDYLRGEGSYTPTVEGIEKALDARIDLVIFTVARKSLLQVLPHFADEIYDKFPTIKHLTLIQLIRVMGDFFALPKELLEPEDFLRLVQSVSLLNLNGFKIGVKNNPLAIVVSKLIKMPWIPLSPPLHRDGRLIVLANRCIALAHSSRRSFGNYEPGMIEKVLSSDEYRNALAPDEATCPSCRYVDLCRGNGMIQPVERYLDMHPEAPYCKRVLDRIAQDSSGEFKEYTV